MRFIRRPALFNLMLIAFALSIALGVGGTIALVSLTLGLSQSNGPSPIDRERLVLESNASQALGNYYKRTGSWDGLLADADARIHLTDLSRVGRAYTLVDGTGRVITSTIPSFATGQVLGGELPNRPAALPIGNAGGGELLIGVDQPPYGPPPAVTQTSTVGDHLRAIISAGLGLAAILFALAAFFSRRISRPLRQLTQAAGTLAAGDLSARVPSSAVREIDSLAGAFNSMAGALSEADAQRRQMTADVAHELRTPLSIIRAHLEGIQDGVYSATPDQMGLLLDETSLLERLIEDLRLLALADTGQLPLYYEALDPAFLLRDTADSFARAASECNVSLRVVLQPGLPEIQADPQRIAQVLGNLVSNALRHTPPGGTVTLTGWVEQVSGAPALLVAVADTGQGIAPADLPHIFDRFWREDRSRARSSGGAGLGLAIARRIVEAHGGRIWAASAPAHGTTVTFTLPLQH